MASSWVLLVVVFALHNGFSEAAINTTTTTAAASPTTSLVHSATESTPTTTSTTAAASPIAATTTSTTAAASQTADATTPATTAGAPPPSTASPSAGFYTYLKGSFKSNECSAAKNDLLNSTFRTFFNDQVFDVMDIKFVVKIDTCQYNFTIKFGPNLQIYNISEVFEAKLKSLSGTYNLTDIKADVYVAGVTLGVFKAGADDCKKICCDGAGGRINLYRTCSPSNLCRSYILKKEEPDCTNVCSHECAGVMYKISLLVLFFGVSMNWFLK